MLNLFKSRLSSSVTPETNQTPDPLAPDNQGSLSNVEQVANAQNPIGEDLPVLVEGDKSLLDVRVKGVPLNKEGMDAVTKLITLAQDASQPAFDRLMYILRVPSFMAERDAVLKDLCLNHFTEDQATFVANCILKINKLKTQQDTLDAYSQSGKSLHRIVVGLETLESEQEAQSMVNGILNLLSKHTPSLMTFIRDESVSIQWRLTYTFLLPPETTPGEKESACQKTFEAALNASIHDLLVYIQDAVERYPHSCLRNTLIQKFINASDTFTSGQRIVLLQCMAESVEKDQCAEGLIQQEALFTVQQRKDCASSMSESPKRESWIQKLDQLLATTKVPEQAVALA